MTKLHLILTIICLIACIGTVYLMVQYSTTPLGELPFWVYWLIGG